MAEMRKLTKRGWTLGIVIPAPYRRELNWGPGDWVALTVEGERLIVQAVRLPQAAPLPPAPARKVADAKKAS